MIYPTVKSVSRVALFLSLLAGSYACSEPRSDKKGERSTSEQGVKGKKHKNKAAEVAAAPAAASADTDDSGSNRADAGVAYGPQR